MKKTIPFFIFIVLVTTCTNPSLRDQTFTGLHQTEIRDRLGEPDNISVLTKNTEYIFGPMEGLWDEIKMGETIVTWIYEDSEGRKELYFLNDSTEVAGEFYWYNDAGKNPVF